MSDKLRLFGLGLVASAGAGILGMTAMMNSAVAYGDPVIPDITQLIGASGLPIPSADYIAAADAFYIQPYLPGTTVSPLDTPENLYPLFPPTGYAGAPEVPSIVNQLTFDSSVAQGVAILNNAIDPGLQSGTAEGVFGYSQSATIASLEMEQLDPAGTPSTLPAVFTLIGDPSLPNGGLLARFPGLDLSALGLTFSGATPADDFATTINTIQYDGFADFPRYPLNFLADLNAFLGIETLHGNYLNPEFAELPRTILPGSALDPVAGGTPSLTNYFIIDTSGTVLNPTGLPLLNPIYDLPGIGHPLAALLDPDLTYLVNLGYGADNLGYSDAPANVATPFGLFPDVNPLTVLQNLATGAQTGVTDMMNNIISGSLTPATAADIGAVGSTATSDGAIGFTSTSMAGALQSLTAGLSPTALADALTAATSTSPTELITNAANAISSATSTLYGSLLPTADIINSLSTSLPAYDLSIIVDNVQAGNLLNAFGLPIAADTALFTLAAGFEVGVIQSTITDVMTELSGAF